MIVELTEEEFAEVEAEVARRNANADREHAQHLLGWSTLANQTLGVVGERVVAKALRLPWAEVRKNYSFANRKRPDVGGYEVRTTRPPHGELVVREGDPSDRVFVLVVPEVRIHDPDNLRDVVWRVAGCLMGSVAKQKQFWRTDRGRVGDPPAWFVPQRFLVPLPPMSR